MIINQLDNSCRILVVDDDKEIANLLRVALEQEEYQVDIANDGISALEQINRIAYDLAILDVMMPKMNGYMLCSKIREKFYFPILMVTAKGTDMDKITGLMMGADDYILKPFNPMEVVMRVKAQLRRQHLYNNAKEKETKVTEYEIGKLYICQNSRSCVLDGEKLELTPTEFDILWYLCEKSGSVVTSEELFEHVWGEKYLENNNTVMAHITRIREKMHEIPRKPYYIKTVWGVGYKID
ncbi:MAG: response regulator transcription factor [Lachnospiraceae bacterium]|nr:response regulator transcription factor [Lachnospiraceae bacterium]